MTECIAAECGYALRVGANTHSNLITSVSVPQKGLLFCPNEQYHRVDRKLVLYLRRLSFLLSIEANPRAWFAGPLGPYHTILGFPASISAFERVIAPGNPTKSPFGFVAFWGVKIKFYLFARLVSRFT